VADNALPDDASLVAASSQGGGTGRRLALALVVALAVQAAFVFSYIGALHSPKPHRVTLGVVGNAQFPAAVAKKFSLHLRSYASEADVRRAIDHRQVSGAFVTGPSGSTLLVVPAAAPGTATALGIAFGAAALALHQKLAVVQLHPLPKGDATGSVSFLLAMALVVGGYLTATMAAAFGGPTTRRGRLAALAVAAVLGGLVADTIAGPVLGAIPTSKFFVLWALFVLVMAAVAFAAAALQSVLGPAGTLVVVVVFVIFGAPAAGGPVPSAFLPGFWRAFGQFLPAGAGTTAIRNTLYFGGHGISRALIVLAAYLVVGALVVVTVRSRRGSTGSEVEAETAAAGAAVI
jgi:hypothetical protein